MQHPYPHKMAEEVPGTPFDTKAHKCPMCSDGEFYGNSIFDGLCSGHYKETTGDPENKIKPSMLHNCMVLFTMCITAMASSETPTPQFIDENTWVKYLRGTLRRTTDLAGMQRIFEGLAENIGHPHIVLTWQRALYLFHKMKSMGNFYYTDTDMLHYILSHVVDSWNMCSFKVKNHAVTPYVRGVTTEQLNKIGRDVSGIGCFYYKNCATPTNATKASIIAWAEQQRLDGIRWLDNNREARASCVGVADPGSPSTSAVATLVLDVSFSGERISFSEELRRHAAVELNPQPNIGRKKDKPTPPPGE